MNLAAIQHEATARWCFALAPGRFLFRLKAAKGDLAAVTLHALDKYSPRTTPKSLKRTPMRLAASDDRADYFEAELRFSMVCLRYWFELTDHDGRTLCFGLDAFTAAPPTDINRMFDCPQTLREEERFLAPAWAANKVVYQVFPSRFAASRPVPDKIWYQAPIGPAAQLYGDLPGLTARLDYLKELGVDVLYMTPVFKANTQHKYDTVDYYQIDPAFGSNADLCALVQKAHALGLRVVLDGVFNHTSPEFFAFADHLQNGPDSAYRDWYYTDGHPQKPLTRGQKPNYKCFGYFGGMPKLNQRNAETARYFIDVALYWLRTAGIDGWRLDVGDEISHTFWRQFRAAVKAEFPDALIVGEVWHYAPDFLQGDEWDTVMNYPFYHAVLDLVAVRGITAGQFLQRLGFLRGNLHPAVRPLLWNLIGSHDTPRFLYECGGDKARMRLAAALQLLLPGMPMLYYGDEVGMTGAKDPDCRRGMLWDPARQDAAMLDWYKTLLRVRHAYPCLTETDPLSQRADDATGLMELQYDGLTLLFHAGEGETSAPDHAGKTDLLTGETFTGKMDPWQAAVVVG